MTQVVLLQDLSNWPRVDISASRGPQSSGVNAVSAVSHGNANGCWYQW